MMPRRSTKPVAFTRFTTLRGRLTPGQLAFAKVAYDGAHPCDLEGGERERARQIWGAGVDRIPESYRSVVVQVKGRDVAGSRLGGERLAHLGETCPLPGLDPDELAYCIFVGPKLRHARIGLRYALAASRRNNLRVEDESNDGFTLHRHDGHRVRFEAFAASRGGDTVRGVPIIGALLDEAGFFFDEATGVVNAERLFGAIIPRLIAGGQILIVSSPWTESGLLHAEFTRNHGHPVTAMAAHCPTLTMRDDPETARTVARERERDPENARREFDAEFLPAGAGYFFDGFAIGQCADQNMPLVLPQEEGWAVVCAYDPAYSRDEAAGVVIRTKDGVFQVVEVFVRTPQKGAPLVPSVVDREFAEVARKHGATHITSDIHYREGVRENTAAFGLRFVEAPPNNAGKNLVYSVAREQIHGGRVRWSAGNRQLTQQLREVVAKPLPGGLVSISSPRRRGQHGDVASAFTLALWLALQAHLAPGRQRARQARRAHVDEQLAHLTNGSLGRYWDAQALAARLAKGPPDQRPVIGNVTRNIGSGMTVRIPIHEGDWVAPHEELEPV